MLSMFEMKHIRTILSLTLAAFLTAPILCAVGVLAHQAHCDSSTCEHAESHFGHEPAEDVLAIAPSLARLLAGVQLPALTTSERPVLEHIIPVPQRAMPHFDSHGRNLPFHASDLPLLA